MKPNIAFDIDGVIINFSDPFIAWMQKTYGIKCIPTNKFHWDLEPNIPPKAFQRIIAEFIRNHSDLMMPFPDGVDLVKYVWERTHKPITFITARDKSTAGATHLLMKKYFPKIDFIIITVDSSKDKIKYLNDFGCFVDDRRRTAIELAESEKTVFMPIKPYNKFRSSYLGIININSCRDIMFGYDSLIFKL